MFKWLWRILPIAVTAVALAFALGRFDLTQLWKTATHLPVSMLAIVLLQLLVGVLLASARVKVIAESLNQTLPFGDAVVATASGNLAGSFFFQIIGQTVVRSTVFARVGISVPTTIVIAGYERIVAAGVSFTLALGGAFFLFHRLTFDLARGGLSLLTIVAGIVVVTLAGATFAWGSSVRRTLRATAAKQSLKLVSRATVITILIQVTTMTAYLAAATSLSHSIPVIKLAAATTLVMFAASVPISLAGWGMREVGAVYALGAIGVPSQVSLVVALLIGFSSIIVMAVVALASSQFVRTRASTKKLHAANAAVATHHAVFLNWFIPLFAASAVFFQIYVPVGAGKLNVNLADSVVLFGGALFVLHVVGRSASPLSDRIPWLGPVIALMSAVIVLAFLHGLFVFGWTSWAFTNRLFGWLVLLAYAGTGALLALDTNANGLQMLLRTFVASGLAVAAFEVILLVALALGAPIPQSILPLRIEGFAQNPNAFGFQLLLIIAAIIALRVSGWRQHLALGLAFIALYLTASRAAEGTAVIMLGAAIALRYVSPRSLAVALGCAAAGVAVIFLIGWVAGVLPVMIAAWRAGNSFFIASYGAMTSGVVHHPLAAYFSTNTYQLTIGDPGSNWSADRWTSFVGGFRMFFAHPLFGAGLGAFVESFERAHGRFLIIHSTPIWLLAETGIVGFLVFAIPGLTIFCREISRSRRGASDIRGVLLVLSLLAFGVMCQVHDLLYQRTLWLILGAALLTPAVARRAAQSVPLVPAVRSHIDDGEVVDPATGRGT